MNDQDLKAYQLMHAKLTALRNSLQPWQRQNALLGNPAPTPRFPRWIANFLRRFFKNL